MDNIVKNSRMNLLITHEIEGTIVGEAEEVFMKEKGTD